MLYTEEERQNALDRILRLATEDDGMVGCILVGSGSWGFTDQYSDLDLCLVVNDQADIEAVSGEWLTTVRSSLPVVTHFRANPAQDMVLYGFFLESFLEVNLCLLRPRDLEARKGNWKVLLDGLGDLDQRMADSWAQKSSEAGVRDYYLGRIAAIWHYVLHAFVALKREHLWQALSDVVEIRNQAISLHGLRKGLVVKRNRDAHKMDPGFLRSLEGSLVGAIAREELQAALWNATRCFFGEARIVENEHGLDSSEPLRRKLETLLREFGKSQSVRQKPGLCPPRYTFPELSNLHNT